jgi:catechol 2,3-dioxygenase-like lactoylglutathione lyase family enzyme
MSSDAVVRRIDHLSVAVARPDEAFAILTGELGLPAMWPPGPFAGFVSGGIALGNVFLETIRWAPGRRSRFRHDTGAICVALEPTDISRAGRELDRRGIPHSAPFAYSGSPSRTPSSPLLPYAPGRGPLFTTMMLSGLMGDELLARRFAREARAPRMTRALSRGTAAIATRVGPIGDLLMSRVVPPTAWPFLCEWNRLDLARSRAVARELLEEAKGGALGVTGVHEIVIGVADLDRERRRWDALLAPLVADDTCRWRFGDGPAIRAEQSTGGSWQRLVLGVSSLAGARAALEERGLLDASTDDELRVNTARLAGLDLRLREAAVRETAQP